ncbi:family 43 glycosylhydrolase [Candidatus Epulonipiscium viviparus]|uniref:family 43 glycosylhydrolase n=1 Tax=Candidatus Epulonipiscium viviparus TaxID=420336 RepID=UPI00273814C6|nr:family 43 glycosylhydrolase [Candidatus Epulopiscium viviparus]
MDRLFIESFFPEEGLADPHALVEGDDIYVICGHDKSPDTMDTWIMDKWIILKSSNLMDWNKVGEILPTSTYIGDKPNCWAGNLKKKNNKYYWFFSDRSDSTGVAVADKPEGPYKDALGHPLIDSTIVSGTRPYDPVVYTEGNDWYIIVGSGKYYIMNLADDLLSITSEPRFLEMLNEKGEHVRMGDKPSLFQRNGLYYLISGGQYGISENLYGPYKYLGFFAPNSHEHNDFFIYHDKYYMTCEYPETSYFYRGVGIVEINFNDDGTIQDPRIHKMSERTWKFDRSTRGYHPISGTSLGWDGKNSIAGKITATDATIESVIWPAGIRFGEKPAIEIILKNLTDATQMELLVASVDNSVPAPLKNPDINWDEATSVILDITPNDDNFKSYIAKLDLATHRLKRIRIRPAKNTDSGQFFIQEINVL